MKTLVTHASPDLDAVASTWLVKRFLPGWKDSNQIFISAGTTYENNDPDSDPDIIHTDTGRGKFDHHQLEDPRKEFCGTRLVYLHLVKNGLLDDLTEQALDRISLFVTTIDHFGEIYFHNPLDDIYDFGLHQILEGMKATKMTDQQICDFGYTALDSILQLFKHKIRAQADIKNGFTFTCIWGTALAMETRNEEALKIALKQGLSLAIRRNPDNGFIRIKSQPVPEIDLTDVYDRLKKIDPEATWFLHISKHMLLNGSSKRQDSVPSRLPLKSIIEIIKKIK